MIKIIEYNILCLFLGYIVIKEPVRDVLIKKGYNSYRFKTYNLENIISVRYLQFINLYSKCNYHSRDSSH